MIPPVADFHLMSLCNKCLRGCFPPFVATFFDVGFEGTLLSGWTSLPMAAVGLSRLGFLGVCFVCAIFPNENNEYFSISIDIYIIGITEQTVGSHLLCVVHVSVLKLISHTQSKVFTDISCMDIIEFPNSDHVQY